MSTGRPQVCTDVGGVSEAVGDAGFVVPPRDHEAVAKACVRLLNDSGLRRTLGGRARQRVLDHFTLQRWNDTYLAIYAELTTVSPATILDELADRVRRVLPDPVDELQVAALLESQGFTDQIADDRYGLPDVFALARRGLPETAARERRDPGGPGRTTGCTPPGPLYVLPSLASRRCSRLGGPTMVHGLVFATAMGWWWSMGMSAGGLPVVRARSSTVPPAGRCGFTARSGSARSPRGRC